MYRITTLRRFLLLLLLPEIALSQSEHLQRTMVINGQSGTVDIFRIDGVSYVELQSLVRIANGSLTFQGDQVIVTIPAAQTSAPAAPSEAMPTRSAMSAPFMKAAVQFLSTAKQWTNTLAYAAQHGVPGDGSRLISFRDRAAEALRLAKVEASSASDQDALQLLTNHFNNVQGWNDKLIGERRSMDTGKYSMSSDAFAADETYQKINNCTTFLSTMLPSGQFQDESSCH